MSIITRLRSMLFPLRTTEQTVQATHSSMFTSLLQPRSVHGVTALTSYQHPQIKAAILENKYHGNSRATKLLQTLLQEWLDEVPGPVLLVPIPLGRRRQRERGYNQVTQIMKGMRLENVSYDQKLLKRTRETPPQTSLDRSARRTNLRDAFAIRTRRAERISASTVVLLDDVLTTGATMAAAQATLAPHLPPHTTLRCVTLAH